MTEPNGVLPAAIIAQVDQQNSMYITEGRLEGARVASFYLDVVQRGVPKTVALQLTLKWISSVYRDADEGMC